MSVIFDVRGQNVFTVGSITMNYVQKDWFKVKMP